MGWPSGIGLGFGSVLLLKVSGSILSGVNLGGLIYLLKKKFYNVEQSTQEWHCWIFNILETYTLWL